MLCMFKNSLKLLPFALQLGLVESLDACSMQASGNVHKSRQRKKKRKESGSSLGFVCCIIEDTHVFVLSRMTNIIIQI